MSEEEEYPIGTGVYIQVPIGSVTKHMQVRTVQIKWCIKSLRREFTLRLETGHQDLPRNIPNSENDNPKFEIVKIVTFAS